MRKQRKQATKSGLAKRRGTEPAHSADFDAVVRLIDAARNEAVRMVNTALTELYWSIGEFIQRKIADAGERVVRRRAVRVAAGASAAIVGGERHTCFRDQLDSRSTLNER